MRTKKLPQVYLDFMIGTAPAGRIIFELFTDLTPKTAQNFRSLCTGERQNATFEGKSHKLHYLNTKIHRIVDNFCIQGGDITRSDGTGGASIYGKTFADENFQRTHSCAGLLSMANRGRDTNSSQFFITLKPAPHLDLKHVVFGQVIQGMEVVRKLAKVKIDIDDKPVIPVVIVGCGQIDDNRSFLQIDPFQKSMFDEIQKQKLELANKKKQLPDGETDLVGEFEQFEQEIKKQVDGDDDAIDGEKNEDNDGDEQNPDGSEQPIQTINQHLNEKQKSRLEELKLKINEAQRLNNRAVIEEQRSSDIDYQKTQKFQERDEQQQKYKEEMSLKGLTENQYYMNTTASKAESSDRNHKKENTTDSFGWNVFNSDSLYNSYFKKCNKLQLNEDAYKQIKLDPEFRPSDDALTKLSENIKEQDEKKKHFSRRRVVNPEEDVTSVNQRNRVFNNKLERHYKGYIKQIRANIQRGTAN